jgi:brefeldin A-inhibited guanine nucleotide-exchange protein
MDILLPLFDVLSKGENKETTEEMVIWMSTTLVNAMKLLVDLFGVFPILITIALDPLLDVFMASLLQENDTLAKLGSSSLHDFIESNCLVFTDAMWTNICSRIVKLFDLTRPDDLYFEVQSPDGTLSTCPSGLKFASKPERKNFQKIIVKCILHLLIIQMLSKILNSAKKDSIYGSLSQKHVFSLGDALYHSYILAQRFNENTPLRHALHQMGFMKQLPNLVKQETSSVSCYLVLLSRMYGDRSPQQMLIAKDIERRLLP